MVSLIIFGTDYAILTLLNPYRVSLFKVINIKVEKMVYPLSKDTLAGANS